MSAAAPAQEESTQRGEFSTSAVEESFVFELALASLGQLELGYDALERSRDRDVREFALASVNTYAPALKELERLAAERELTYPESLGDYPAYIPDRPWTRGEVDFDRAYMEEQVRLWEQTVELFTNQAVNGTDEGMRAYAWTNITRVRRQLDRAQQILNHLDAVGEL